MVGGFSNYKGSRFHSLTRSYCRPICHLLISIRLHEYNLDYTFP